MKVLNVTTKNVSAESLATLISNGNFRMRNGESFQSKIYEFNMNLFNTECQMVFTSISGHLFSLDFIQNYKDLDFCNIEEILSVPVVKFCRLSHSKIKLSLQKEACLCNKLIIWTDCDREGENIGFEIVNVCKEINPSLDVYRAMLSEISSLSVQKALHDLKRPHKNMSDALDAQLELDLRIG